MSVLFFAVFPTMPATQRARLAQHFAIKGCKVTTAGKSHHWERESPDFFAASFCEQNQCEKVYFQKCSPDLFAVLWLLNDVVITVVGLLLVVLHICDNAYLSSSSYMVTSSQI